MFIASSYLDYAGFKSELFSLQQFINKPNMCAQWLFKYRMLTCVCNTNVYLT